MKTYTIKNKAGEVIFEGDSLKGANLEGANLRDANLEGANLEDAYLRESNLALAELAGADLRYANLRYADLERADLKGANLERADLKGANLEGANLYRANLEGANLESANLRDTCVFTFTLGKDFGFCYGDYIQIGCEHHTITYWKKHYKDIGNTNEYSGDEIYNYGVIINALARTR